MAWLPVASEVPLVDCSVEPRAGMRFDLWVSENHVCYSRLKLSFTDSLDTVTIPRANVSKVVLKKKSPWLLRSIGLVLIAATTLGVISFILGTVDKLNLILLGGYVLGGACFLGSSNRWQLSFSDGKKTHKLVQPVASDKQRMMAMAQALQDTGRILSAGPTAVGATARAGSS